MRMIEWAFEQDIPTAEKLVLVYLAWNANGYGVGPMDKTELKAATRYKNRSMQRLLKSLKDLGMYRDSGFWYVIGDSPLDTMVPELSDELSQLSPGQKLREENPMFAAPYNAEEIAQAVGEYVIDQLNNFEARFTKQVERLAMFHVEPETEIPPDPALVNPLYQLLLDTGQTPARAYALSQADLALEAEAPIEYTEIFESPEFSDPDTSRERFEQVVSALGDAPTPAAWLNWQALEAQENKFTVEGEPDAFVQLFPAILSAAAVVDDITIEQFTDPKVAAMGQAPWDKENNPIDKEDPALAAEISIMLAALEAANDPRCEVQPRTKEVGDDGIERTETLLGFHRRVSAKHRQMQQLQSMGVIG